MSWSTRHITRALVRTLHDYLNELASASPTPGGGSAAMIVAETGVSLVAMVARICLENAAYAAQHPRLQRIAGRTEELRAALEAARHEDERAFSYVVEAMALPKGAQRTERMQQALLGAARAPLHGARLCLAVLHAAPDVAEIDNANLASDVGCAAEFAASALFACAYNVRINHRYMKDAAAIAVQRERIDRYEREARALLEGLRAHVARSMNA